MNKATNAKELRAIIFDFDGTIADSFEIFVETLEKLLGRPEPMQTEEINKLRGLSVKEITRHLGVRTWQLPNLIVNGRREIGKRFDSVNAFEGIPESIKQLSSEGYELYILSTNAQNVIVKFLDKHDLTSYFKDTYGDIGLTGKTRSLKRLQKNNRLSPDECIYVGDEPRDIEAARKAAIKCVSVTWGYSTATSLKSYKPDYTASTTQELVDTLKAVCSRSLPPRQSST